MILDYDGEKAPLAMRRCGRKPGFDGFDDDRREPG